jgi:5'-nucleotidase
MRATNPNSLVVSAGDLIGASPLLSAAFHDEPTIEAMNQIGLDLNAVGNHEFDEGEEELLRMQSGGCHPTDTAGTCKDADGRFDGANFEFLADGGDGFSVFPTGTNRVGGAVDTDALERYFATAPELSPPALNRIDVVP